MIRHSFTIGDLFTDDEIRRMVEIGDPHRIADEVIRPIIDRIDTRTGQKNDPLYWGYAVKWAIGASQRG